MAECSTFDFNSCLEELTSIKESSTSAVEKLTALMAKQEAKASSIDITALSWNIAGTGKVEVRYFLVPKVVGDINPDVVLLQEAKNVKIVELVASTCSLMLGRSYEYVYVHDETSKEGVAVLYDSNVFTKLEETPMDLTRFVKKVFKPSGPNTKKSNEEPPQVKVIKNHVAAVQLKHKVTEKQIVFMSFQNLKQNKKEQLKLAKGFCEIASKIASDPKVKTLVVAGAGLNIERSSISQSRSVFIPDYTQMGRKPTKLFHFVFAGPGDVNKDGKPVSAHKIIPDTDTSSEVAYSIEEYEKSLKHDPLLCELSIM